MRYKSGTEDLLGCTGSRAGHSAWAQHSLAGRPSRAQPMVFPGSQPRKAEAFSCVWKTDSTPLPPSSPKGRETSGSVLILLPSTPRRLAPGLPRRSRETPGASMLSASPKRRPLHRPTAPLGPGGTALPRNRLSGSQVRASLGRGLGASESGEEGGDAGLSLKARDLRRLDTGRRPRKARPIRLPSPKPPGLPWAATASAWPPGPHSSPGRTTACSCGWSGRAGRRSWSCKCCRRGARSAGGAATDPGRDAGGRQGAGSEGETTAEPCLLGLPGVGTPGRLGQERIGSQDPG